MLLQGRAVLTCAHVVNAALGLDPFGTDPPEDDILLDLPARPELGTLTARVVPESWISAARDRAEDIAVLTLPAAVLPPLDSPRLRLRATADQEFSCHGFPSGREDPVLSVGTVQGAIGPGFGWRQLVSPGTTGFRIEQGFSGAPVWTSTGGGSAAIAGIVVSTESDASKRVAGLLPFDRIADLPVLAEALTESALFEPEAYQSHWEPAVRGARSVASQGWYFTGRAAVLTEATSWLGAGAGSEPVCVVTGPPGSGKSAVLARLATASSAAFRAQYPEMIDEALPAAGSIQVAVHARSKTLADVCTVVADAAGCPDDGAEQLVAHLARAEGSFTLLIDALDEALEVGEIIHSLLRPLLVSANPDRLRLLIGTRPHLVHALGPGVHTLALDDPAYADQADLETYTRSRLAGLGPPEQIASIAAEIAASAFPLFLVAQLTADALQTGGPEGLSNGDLPSTVPQAMELYLLRSFRPDEAGQARDLLRPLALAQGDGLPVGPLWARLAGGLAGRRYDEQAVGWLIDRAPALLAVTDGAGGPSYRLFHAAFAEGLGSGLDSRKGAFFDALLSTVPYDNTTERRSWRQAQRYVRRHLAHHAADAGRLGDLLAEPGYLAVADPIDVLTAQTASGHALGREISQVMAMLATEPGADDPSGRSPIVATRLLFRGRTDLSSELLSAVPPGRWQPLWFARSGEPGGHQGIVHAVTWILADERRLVASCADDGSLLVWEVTDSKVEVVASVDAHVGGAFALLHLPALGLLVSAGADGLAFWDPETLEPRGSVPAAHDAAVTALGQYTVDGVQALVSGAADGTLRLWSLPDDRELEASELYRAHAGSVLAIDLMVYASGAPPDLVTVGADGYTVFWDPITCESRRDIPAKGDGVVTSAAIAPTDEQLYVAYGTDAGTLVERTVTLGADGDGSFSTKTHRLRGPQPVRATAVLHATGTPYLAYGLGANLFSLPFDNEETELFVTGLQGISALAALDGSAETEPALAVGGTDGSLRIWRTSGFGQSSFDQSPRIPGYPDVRSELSSRPSAVTAVGMTATPAGTVAVTAGGGSVGYRYELLTRDETSSGTTTTHNTARRPVVEFHRVSDGTPAGPSQALEGPGVLALAADSDQSGRLRVAAGFRNGEAHSWTVGSGATAERQLVKRRKSGFNMAVAMTAGSLDGRAGLATAASEGGVWFLALGDRKPRRLWRKGDAEILTMGRLGGRDVVATWSRQDQVKLWDAGRGRELGSFVLPDQLRISALSVRDSLLVAGAADGTVTVVALDPSGTEIARTVHRAHTGPVNVLCSTGSGDELVVVSGGQDGTLRFWPQKPGSRYPESIPLATPILSAGDAGTGVLLVGTGFGALALTVGAAVPGPR